MARNPAVARDPDGFRPDIEGLRGIAVLLVVLFHAGLLSNSGIRLSGGFVGVDLFFVISGFLITGLLIRERERDGRISLTRFYARRVRRILPAAAVVLLITIPASYGLVALLDRPQAMQDGVSAALSVANIRFALTTDYFNPARYSPFLHFWSLGVEEQFYLLWPAIVILVAWRRPRPGTAVALALIAAGSFAASVLVTQQNPATAFYLLPTRAWQLAAGGLLAVGAGSLERVPAPTRVLVDRGVAVAGWAGLIALLLTAYALDSATTAYPGWAALVPTVAGMALIVSGSQRRGPGVLLRLLPVRFFGKISYSLYLWHWPFLILGGLLLNGPLNEWVTRGQALVLVALSIGAATLTWAFVEEPFRRGRVPLPRPSRVVAAGVAVMAAVALVGVGLDFRANGAIAALGAQAVDASPGQMYRLSPYVITAAVHPSVVKASSDNEKVLNDECVTGLQQTTVVSPLYCRYGSVDSHSSVAVIGDSHASALFPAIDIVAKEHNWRLLPMLKIGCSFLDIPLYMDSLKREYTECATWSNNVVSALNAAPPEIIIISMSRWMVPMLTTDRNVTTEGESLARMIERLPKSSRVVIIADVPLPSADIPRCLSLHPGDYRQCATSRSAAFGWEMGQREQLAARLTGARLMNLDDEICPGGGDCPAIIDNVIVWRDNNHLTATFAATLAPAVDRKLTEALSSPGQPPATNSP